MQLHTASATTIAGQSATTRRLITEPEPDTMSTIITAIRLITAAHQQQPAIRTTTAAVRTAAIRQRLTTRPPSRPPSPEASTIRRIHLSD